MRIAIVHDYLNQYGGAERVFETLLTMFPRADVFLIVYDQSATTIPASLKKELDRRTIHLSFINRLPLGKKRHDLYATLTPHAVERWNFTPYDLVISSTSSYSKGIVVSPHTLHISYLHTPTRYLWESSAEYVKKSYYNPLIKALYQPFFKSLRAWDFLASKRPDFLIANSKYTQRRIKKYYREPSTLIYPPCPTHLYLTTTPHPQDYFLVVSRLVHYKQIDHAIDACNQRKLKLKIVGTGPYYKTLKKHSGSSIEFCGFVTEEEKRSLLAGARGFIFPQVEDFGITAIEALATGVPVIAYHGGSSTELIRPRVNGVLYEEYSSQGLIEALANFENHKFDARIIKQTATQFSTPHFIDRLNSFITQSLETYNP